jgi:hypothetical protein
MLYYYDHHTGYRESQEDYHKKGEHGSGLPIHGMQPNNHNDFVIC